MIKSKVKFVNLSAITLVLIAFSNNLLAQNNLLDTSSWTVGSGSVNGFNKIGATAENIREIGIDPYGNNSVLWKAAPASNTSVGWQTPFLSIDETKTYRLTVWVKKTNSDSGKTRFGFQSRNASNELSSLRTDGAIISAPYFLDGDLPELNKWFLLVGYAHSSSYTGNEILSGIYDPVTGNKVLNAATDFKFAPGTITIRHRIWLRETTNPADLQFMFEPTIYEVNGQEPSIADLINPNSGNSDTQAPIAPTLVENGKTDTTVNLSWSGATDNTAVTGYRIFKDGVLENTLANVDSYAVTGLTENTAYSFTATALDAAGNESTSSNALNITTNASSGGGDSVWSETASVASYTGNVAVGTNSVPSGYKMAVDGNLIAEEVKVQLSGNWPDYVFTKDYDLSSLEEVQRHIKEKGHLPNIPSAKKVKENGIELGEMNRLLLEKIEELTLYIIQQKKESTLLKKRIEVLEKDLK
ncbi:fibronectin type III domain-containing protein [uncultured Croceitalea sp.]|uniref:fibronectin type III domain-containing protein n=1 Tax=uncultured Croceitalea sp. TaxID=1798908 RepID=UPI003305A125